MSFLFNYVVDIFPLKKHYHPKSCLIIGLRCLSLFMLSMSLLMVGQMTAYPNVANGQSEHTTGIITLDKTTYTIGEAIHVTIIDPDNVFVSWSPEYCPIRIILTSNPLGVCHGVEYGADGSIVTNVSFGTSTQIAYYPHDYIKAKHGDVITVIYYDAISENGQPAEVTATARFEVTPLEAFPSSGLQHTITFSFDGPNGHETHNALFRQSNGKIQGMQLYELRNGNIDSNGNITIESICPNDSRYSSTWTGVLNSDGTGSGTYQCSNGVGGTWNAISAENKAPNIPASYQWDAFVSVTCIDCNKEMFYGNTMTIRAHAKDPLIVYKHVLVTIMDPYGNIAMTKEMVIPKSGEVEEMINITPEIFKYPGFYIVKGKLLLPYPRVFGTDECTSCASFKISEKNIPQTSPQTPSIPEYTPPKTPSIPEYTLPLAPASKYNTYQNQKYGFSMQYPSSWINQDTSLRGTEGVYITKFTSASSDAALRVVLRSDDTRYRGLDNQHYSDMLIESFRQECTNMSFEIYGVTCSDFKVSNTNTGYTDKGYFTYVLTYTQNIHQKDGTVHNTAYVILQIPDGKDTWILSIQTFVSEMETYTNELEVMTNSFTIFDYNGYAQNPNQKTIAESMDMKTKTAKTLTHENKQYGFSVNYPSTWQKDTTLDKDSDNPNRMTLATFFHPQQDGLFIIGLAENDPYLKGLDGQQLLDAIKQELTTYCTDPDCTDLEFLSSGVETHVNGYKLYYVTFTSVITIDESTMNTMFVYAIIPDGDDFWLMSTSFFDPDTFDQLLTEITPMAESFTIFDYEGEQIAKKVPEWFKGTTKWWADGQVDDQTFLNGVGFMIKEDIIHIPVIPEQAVDITKEKIPDWVRINAKWWADGKISEDEFVNGIEYLVKNGIILAN